MGGVVSLLFTALRFRFLKTFDSLRSYFYTAKQLETKIVSRATILCRLLVGDLKNMHPALCMQVSKRERAIAEKNICLLLKREGVNVGLLWQIKLFCGL